MDPDTDRTHVKTDRENWSDTFTSQETSRTGGHRQKAAEARMDFPLGAPRKEPSPPTH